MDDPGDPRRAGDAPAAALPSLNAERSEGFRRLLVELIPDAIVVTDLDGRIVYLNEVGRRLAAPWPAERLLGNSIYSLLLPEEVSRAKESASARLAGFDGPRQYRLSLPGGGAAVAEVNGRLLRDEGGVAHGVVYVVRDVTDRERDRESLRASEEQLRLSEERFAKAFNATPGAVSINRARDGRYVDINPGFETVTGFRRDEVIGRTTAELGIWNDERDRDRLLAALGDRGEIDQLEAEFRMKDGTVRRGQLWARLISFGGEAHILTITRDVHDERRAEAQRAALEQQLAQAQKMEAVGRLAGGIAHDFNNLLTVILGHAGVLLDHTPAGEAQADVTAILEAATRAAALTAQLLAFSRKTIVQPRVTSLGDLVRGMEGMLRRLLGEDIDLRISATGAGRVSVDKSQFEQVVLNLSINARDAMPHGGRLSIEIADDLLGDDRDAEWTAAPAGSYVRMSVQDNGTGMDKATLARLFEPFFTTKERGKGTGLGLSTVHGIVSQSGGFIRVSSQPGAGSRFTILLPSAQEGSLPIVPAPPAAVSGAGTEQVLLVEDDDAVRRLAASVLRRRGYRVMEAANGEEAVAVLEAAEVPVDLVITDIVMPGMGGIELLDRLPSLAPDARVLLLSGYTDDVTGRATASSGSVPFLQKPFSPAALLAQVRSVLDAGIS